MSQSQRQPLIGPDDPHVVPHQPPDEIPVMGYHDHFIVGKSWSRSLPNNRAPRAERGFARTRYCSTHSTARRVGKNHGFQQRIAGKAVCPVQSGAGALADCVKVLDRGAPRRIGDYPSAHVMGGGNDRNRVFGDVDPQGQTLLMDVGETLLTNSVSLWLMSRKTQSSPLVFISVSIARATISRNARSLRDDISP